MAALVQQLQRLSAGAILLMALGVPGIVQAQSLVLAGRMGDKAVVVVNGQPQTLAVGQSAQGVTLLRWVGQGDAAAAEVQTADGVTQLRIGGAPARVGGSAARPAGREIVLTAGPGGHFTSAGSINGKPVRFVVDTGATLIALGRDDALRIGLDLRGARTGHTQTANGVVEVQLVTLNSVRVGDVELSNVGATVLPHAMPVVLLGNSFLSRLQMRRENDVMRLELK